jgi:hypothetical protein
MPSLLCLLASALAPLGNVKAGSDANANVDKDVIKSKDKTKDSFFMSSSFKDLDLTF